MKYDILPYFEGPIIISVFYFLKEIASGITPGNESDYNKIYFVLIIITGFYTGLKPQNK